MSSIVIEDQVGARPPKQAIVLEWNDGVPCTVRDLIAESVRYEHERIHAPTASLSANDIVYLPDSIRFDKVDADEAVRRAPAAFSNMGFVLFADGRQMADLDSVIRLAPTTTVKFVKLLPLKGAEP